MMRAPASRAVQALIPKDVIPTWWRTGRQGQRPSSTSSISSRLAITYFIGALPQVVARPKRRPCRGLPASAPHPFCEADVRAVKVQHAEVRPAGVAEPMADAGRCRDEAAGAGPHHLVAHHELGLSLEHVERVD